MRKTLCLIAFAILAPAQPSLAAADERPPPAPAAATAAGGAGAATGGGCSEQSLQAGFFIEDGKRVFDDERFQAFTIQLDTVAYKSPSVDERMPKTLGFDQRVAITDPGQGGERVRVRALSDEDLGWIERDDLLCRVFPLTDAQTGLLQRVVIQTETSVQSEVVPRTAYHSPKGGCEGGDQSCPKLSRFQWYFVYGESGGKLLLSESANLGGRDAHLVGWLPEQDGIKWNTAVALRPSEALEGKKSADGSTEAHVCAYPSLDTMNDPKACRPILGGLRWFKIDTRLPILRDDGKAYEVAISSAATSGTFEQALSLARIDALKNVDVFFVIDGTKSMQGVIEAIKGRPGYPGVVDQIRARIKGKVKQGGAVRYGYRIYRDSTKGGKSGVEDDGMPLPDDCSSNEDKFVQAFANVRAADIDQDDDYPENLFGGLVQASRDLSTCPDHLKLVVAIGDHGYDAASQKGRGQPAYDYDTVTERFMRGRRVNTQPVVVFIQTASVVGDAKSPELYDKAYALFQSQGLEMLKRVYKPLQGPEGAGIKPESFFFRLPSKDANFAVVESIIDQVDQLLQPDVVAKLSTRLNAGESLADVITSLQKGDRANVPVLYWNVVADALCKRLGDQCSKKVLEGVFRAYVPHSTDLRHDVLLSQQQLDDWRELLGKFKTFWSQLRSGERSRAQLVNVLMESIGSVLKLDIDDSGKTMGEIVQLVGGLPYGAESKLMAYSPNELRSEELIKQCEIQHLVNYAGKKSDIVQIALDGDKLPVFDAELLPQSACPELSKKGQSVPHIPGAPRPRALNAADGNTDYSLSFRKGNDRYFWVPVDYLP